MTGVNRQDLPAGALLSRYATQGAYTDCYTITISAPVTLPDYICAFYTTPLFRLERLLIKWFAGRPSTQTDVQALADGASESFAAWYVEARATEQLLLTDIRGNTRSWLMVEAAEDATRLYFGSAVLHKATDANGNPKLSLAFTLLLPFHWLYSRLLLRSAAAKLAHSRVIR